MHFISFLQFIRRYNLSGFAVYPALQFCCLLLSFFLAVYQLSCRLSGVIFCFIFLLAYFFVALLTVTLMVPVSFFESVTSTVAVPAMTPFMLTVALSAVTVAMESLLDLTVRGVVQPVTFTVCVESSMTSTFELLNFIALVLLSSSLHDTVVMVQMQRAAAAIVLKMF